MRNVFMIIDMLNGFCDEKGTLFVGADARAIIPFVVEKVNEAYKGNKRVIFLADNHVPDDPEFKQWPPHCLKGSWESEIIPEIPVDKNAAILIPKTRFSGFYNTPLDEILKMERPHTVEVAGVCTNICVLYTVADLRNRDYNVIVYKDGTASFDREAHTFALKELEKVLGAKVI